MGNGTSLSTRPLWRVKQRKGEERQRRKKRGRTRNNRDNISPEIVENEARAHYFYLFYTIGRCMGASLGYGLEMR